MKFKKHGETTYRESAKQEWNTIFEKLREYGETKSSFGFSSYHKIKLPREQALEFVKYLKQAGFIKVEEHDYTTIKELNVITYSKVLQSPSRRLNYDFHCRIQRYGTDKLYTVGIAYKGIYPKHSTRKLSAKHSPMLFMW